MFLRWIIRLDKAGNFLTAHRLFMQGFHVRSRDGSWIRVFENFAFEVTQSDFVRTGIYHVVRIDGNFSAAARAIDDELWHGVSGGVTAKGFDNIHAFRDGGAEV